MKQSALIKIFSVVMALAVTATCFVLFTSAQQQIDLSNIPIGSSGYKYNPSTGVLTLETKADYVLKGGGKSHNLQVVVGYDSKEVTLKEGPYLYLNNASIGYSNGPSLKVGAAHIALVPVGDNELSSGLSLEGGLVNIGATKNGNRHSLVLSGIEGRGTVKIGAGATLALGSSFDASNITFQVVGKCYITGPIESLNGPYSSLTVNNAEYSYQSGNEWSASRGIAKGGATVRITPTSGKTLTKFEYEASEKIDFRKDGDSYVFTMPDEDVTITALYEGETGSGSSNSSSSGKTTASSSSSSEDSIDTDVPSTIPITYPAVTREMAREAFDAGLALARETGGDTIAVRLANRGELPQDIAQLIAQWGQSVGMETLIYADSVQDNTVTTRLKIDPGQINGNISLRVDDKLSGTDVIKSRFQKHYSNSLDIVHLEQTKGFGGPVEIAAKVNVSGLNTENVAVYSYSSSNNSYDRISADSCWVDGKGYVHFTTSSAGDFIISNGPLSAKTGSGNSSSSANSKVSTTSAGASTGGASSKTSVVEIPNYDDESSSSGEEDQ